MWTLAVAQTAEKAASPMGGGPTDIWQMVWIFAIFGGIMYFLMIRPNQKKEKDRQQMLDGLAKHDRIVTVGGVMGTIVSLSDKTVVLRVSDEPPVKIEFLKHSISRVISREGEKELKKKES